MSILKVAQELIDIFYPIGSIYITETTLDPNVQFGGTWEKIGANKCLMSANNNNELKTTVESGLPNITGRFGITTRYSSTDMTNRTYGAFSFTNQGTPAEYAQHNINDVGGYVDFSANNSNQIYGRSSIVQPPSYKVYFWRRIA